MQSLKMPDRRALIGLLTYWLKYQVVWSCRGIGQFSCHNRSQQHVEAIYGSFDFISPARASEKHPTENGVIAGKLLSHQMILETKQVLFCAHVHSIDPRSRNAYDHLEDFDMRGQDASEVGRVG